MCCHPQYSVQFVGSFWWRVFIGYILTVCDFHVRILQIDASSRVEAVLSEWARLVEWGKVRLRSNAQVQVRITGK